MKLTFEIEPVEQARPRATRMGKVERLEQNEDGRGGTGTKE